jgi:hypothetical protein
VTRRRPAGAALAKSARERVRGRDACASPARRRRSSRALRAHQHSRFSFYRDVVRAADFLDVPWKAVPATGVEMKLTQTDALRVDFDFHGRAGYAIARRDGRIELPENFELAFRVKGDAPRNTLEMKFVQADNVWWSVRREFEFPGDWRRVSVKKRQIEFAWGPIGPSPLPKTIDAIELVITAGTGGKGTVWFDDVEIREISGDVQEIGGIVLEKPDAAGKTWIPMPDATRATCAWMFRIARPTDA